MPERAKAESDIALDTQKIDSNERRDALRNRANKSLAREKTMADIAKQQLKDRQ